MATTRQWSYPATATTTEVNDVVTVTAPTPGPGFTLGLDILQATVVQTAPGVNSASVFAPASYTAQTASVATVIQNTLGYDANFVAYFQGAASVATFQVGVSATTPVPVSAVTSSRQALPHRPLRHGTSPPTCQVGTTTHSRYCRRMRPVFRVPD